ncbi:MAG: bifunctional diaminohydroxyphosphoribosylaminopyrimidine deaminase/5-amino-6-(5-phosphoribosylamino)uracil reductase RibD, partial [Tepidiformaceae bacterium]
MIPASTYMKRALAAAHAVRGFTSPNPWVGAVVVRDGEVLSVGATSPPGGAHAEAAALAGAHDASSSDVYVTLEPCAPFPGKRTPPCAQALVDAGVRRVVVALEDPDPNMRGRGIALLRAAGVEVETGDGAGEALAQLRPYIKHRQTGLPYVIAKFAASLDGRVATASGDSKWITGQAARDRAHEERAWVDAIMVGSGTVLADDPALTARPGGEAAAHQPVRIVLDGRGRVAPEAALFRQPGHTIVATSQGASRSWKAAIAAAGAQLIECE